MMFFTTARDRFSRNQRVLSRRSLYALIAVLTSIVAPPVRAVDGCLVLLCFAAPNWRAVSQCVPPIHEVLHDLARGRPFPTCAFSGAGNSASHRWASAPGYCPPQYTFDGDGSPVCGYSGAISVDIEGALWTRTWWGFNGDTVTEYTPKAKAQLGSWDPRFDDDYAAWLAGTMPTPCTDC